MKKIIGVGMMLGFVLASSTAFAQEEGMKEIVFEEDSIEGDLMTPGGTDIGGHQDIELSTLIKAREDFVDEMRKTVDEL